MRNFTLSLCVVGVAALAGCNNSTTGTGGTTNKGGTPVAGDTTFKLTLPTTAVGAQQGEKKDFTIDLTHGTAFAEDVAVTFEAPPGLKIDPVTIKKGESKVVASVTVDEKTEVGTKEVKVKGKPGKGDAVDGMFKVEVSVKK